MKNGKKEKCLFLRGVLIALSCIVLSLFTFHPVFAEESNLKKILENKEILVGTSGDYRPFSFLNPQTNNYEGMDIEAAQKLGKALGAKVTFVKFKWPELIKDLLAGKFDIAMGGVSRSLARARVAAYTKPYMTMGTCPLVRKGEEGKYQDFASVDQPGVKIILNQGGSNDRYFTPRIKKATILRHNKNEEIALKVKDGTADVWITDNVEALFWAENLPGVVAANPTNTYTVKTKGYLIRQGDQVFLNWLNLWIEQMFLQGEIQKLQKKWLGIILK